MRGIAIIEMITRQRHFHKKINNENIFRKINQ